MVEVKQIIGFVTFGFSCLSVIFAILALALADWVVAGTLSVSAGLWQGCIDDICVTYPASAVQGFLHAIRAMVLLGLFAMVGATAMTGVHVFCARDNRLVMYASICLAAVAGLFLMIGFAIFADKSHMSQDMTVATFGPLDPVHCCMALCVGRCYLKRHSGVRRENNKHQ
ncbi:uncharacterized protein LOC127880671 [Dreissena polymorpha]|uniref:Uncharacterized protein n=1 Tax=Dreissena polymorpha TaxID=45954 RepID=A0A9D4H023_DREPO|nr:uncharacterized protein LOC127880671 [Dreissena polymorpha]KAH3826150.1 hypothetical protein DPMN_128046 [Dreissena polymorpha]